MTGGADLDLARVDLAVVFFCAVLVIFAFVTLTPPTQPRPDLPSAGAPVEEFTAVPPTWQAVYPRSTIAVLDAGRLLILDLAAMTGPVVATGRSQIAGRQQVQLSGRDPAAPAAYRFALVTDIDGLPADWIATEIALQAGPDTGSCPWPPDAAGGRPLTVFVPPDRGASLSAFLRGARACGARYRLVPADPPRASGLYRLRIVTGPDRFALDRMFR